MGAKADTAPAGAGAGAKGKGVAPIAGFPLLAAYVRMWAVGTMCRTLGRSGRELTYNEPVALCAFVAFCFPLQPAALLLGFGARVAALVASLPYVHVHDAPDRRGDAEACGEPGLTNAHRPPRPRAGTSTTASTGACRRTARCSWPSSRRSPARGS